ncbi:DUF5819 family protein [Streptomyces luteolifulvus]|uniref:DUF5819 family protein n=1 Tax=Streptomyces luteolifulvus TaxID=2615112 RepID=UPI001CD98F35|nr:DUF5819 family protein [Streptomyces luteolifulvus]
MSPAESERSPVASAESERPSASPAESERPPAASAESERPPAATEPQRPPAASAEPQPPSASPAPYPAALSAPGRAATPPAPAPALPPSSVGRGGVAALSVGYQIGVAVALAVVAIGVWVHLGMVFLHVAPSNTVTKQHGTAVYDWINPEFEQNWMLFAPNPLQQNIAVQVRAEVATAEGGVRTTGWYDLSAQDGRAIDGSLLPSHTQQNELRRAWDFFVSTHDGRNRASGLRGSLSETYLRRIVVLRLEREDAAGPGGVVERVQVRARTTNVRPPKWSREQIPDDPVYRELSWWSLPAGEAEGGVR